MRLVVVGVAILFGLLAGPARSVMAGPAGGGATPGATGEGAAPGAAGGGGANRPVVDVVKFSTRPAAPGVPALKYHFMAEMVDQIPGNAALLYLTAAQQMAAAKVSPAADQVNARDRKPAESDEDNIDRFLDSPIKTFPKAEARDLLGRYEGALRQMQLAALRDHCDFDTPYRTEGFRTLLPYLNDSRALARLAAVQARLRMAEGNSAGAVESLGLIFTQSRHLNEQAFVIQMLVSASISHLALKQIPDLVQMEKSPNLYWTLGALPSPLLDLRPSWQFERASLYFSIPQLKDARAGRLTAEQWQQVMIKLREMRDVSGLHSYGGDDSIGLVSAFAAAREYPRAKKYLVEMMKIPADEVEKMTVPAVLGTYNVAQFERWNQELDKWLTLPFWQGYPGLLESEAKMVDSLQEWTFLSELVPAAGRMFVSGNMPGRRLALLRTIEAVRAYAAAHEGKAPAKLEDITATPAILDPMTGKAFKYEITAGGFTIEGPALERSKGATTGIRYEVIWD